MKAVITVLLLIVGAATAAVAAPIQQYDDETRFLFALSEVDLTWVNFDASPQAAPIPTGQTLTGSEWASLGVVFSSPGNELVTSASVSGTASSPPNYLSVVDGGGNENLIMSFDTPVWAVGFTLLGPDFASANDKIVFKSTAGGVIMEMGSPKMGFETPLWDPSFFVGLISEDPIGSVEILRGTSETDPVGLDDVIFAVPEPDELVLVCLGCILLAWCRRKKRSTRLC